MKIKLVQKWRDNPKGKVVDVSENRAGLLIRSGFAVGLQPKVETADAAPKIDDNAKAKAKAEADAVKVAEEKAKAEAKAAKADAKAKAAKE